MQRKSPPSLTEIYNYRGKKIEINGFGAENQHPQDFCYYSYSANAVVTFISTDYDTQHDGESLTNWKIYLSIHPDDLEKAWDLIRNDLSSFTFLKKSCFQIVKTPLVNAGADIHQHFIQQWNAKIFSECQDFHVKTNAILFNTLYRALNDLQYYFQMQQIDKKIKTIWESNYQILYQAFKNMVLENGLSCANHTEIYELLKNLINIPDERNNIGDLPWQAFRFNSKVHRQNTRNDFVKNVLLFKNLHEKNTVDFSVDEKSQVNTALTEFLKWNIKDENEANRINFNQSHVDGAQIIIFGAKELIPNNQYYFYLNNLENLLKSNEIRPGNRFLESEGKLNSYCTLRDTHTTPEKYTGIVDPSFYSVPEYVDPSQNPFFNIIVDHWVKNSIHPPAGDNTTNKSWLEQVGYALNQEDYTPLHQLIFHLNKNISITENKNNIIPDEFLNFVMHALHARCQPNDKNNLETYIDRIAKKPSNPLNQPRNQLNNEPLNNKLILTRFLIN